MHKISFQSINRMLKMACKTSINRIFTCFVEMLKISWCSLMFKQRLYDVRRSQFRFAPPLSLNKFEIFCGSFRFFSRVGNQNHSCHKVNSIYQSNGNLLNDFQFTYINDDGISSTIKKYYQLQYPFFTLINVSLNKLKRAGYLNLFIWRGIKIQIKKIIYDVNGFMFGMLMHDSHCIDWFGYHGAKCVCVFFSECVRVHYLRNKSNRLLLLLLNARAKS